MVLTFQEERQKRLGPGGLDPVEVFESLPDVSCILLSFISFIFILNMMEKRKELRV